MSDQSAALLTPYGPMVAIGENAAPEITLITTPPPASIILGISARQRRRGPKKFTSSVRCHGASVVSSNGVTP